MAYTYATTAGNLPTGLTLATTGLLTGTPTAKGTFTFTITVTDSLSNTANQAFTVTVGAPASGGGRMGGFGGIRAITKRRVSNAMHRPGGGGGEVGAPTLVANVVIVTPKNPGPRNTQMTLTAAVGPSVAGGAIPTGTVTFYNDGNPISPSAGLVNGYATVGWQAITGTYFLQATYGGDVGYGPNATVPVTQELKASASAIPWQAPGVNVTTGLGGNNLDNTGATDCALKWQNELNNGNASLYYFPAGTYVFNASGINEVQTLNFTDSTDAFTLTIPDVNGVLRTTGSITNSAVSATLAASIQTAINAVSQLNGLIVAAAGTRTGWVTGTAAIVKLTFSGTGFAGKPVAATTCSLTTVQCTIWRTIIGGCPKVLTTAKGLAIVGDVDGTGNPTTTFTATTANTNGCLLQMPWDSTGANGSVHIANINFDAPATWIGLSDGNCADSAWDNCVFQGNYGHMNITPFACSHRNCTFTGAGGAPTPGSLIGLLTMQATWGEVDNCTFTGWVEGVRGGNLAFSRNNVSGCQTGWNIGVFPVGGNFQTPLASWNNTFIDNDIAIQAQDCIPWVSFNDKITGTTNSPAGQSVTGVVLTTNAQEISISGLNCTGTFSTACIDCTGGPNYLCVDHTSILSNSFAGNVTIKNQGNALHATFTSGAFFPSLLSASDVTASNNLPSPLDAANVHNVTAAGIVAGATDGSANSNAMHTLLTGGTFHNGDILYFPAGVYNFNATIDMSAFPAWQIWGDLMIGGDTSDGTVIKGSGNFGSPGILLKADYGTGCGTFQLRNLSLAHDTTAGDVCFSSTNPILANIENVQFGGAIGVRLTNPYKCSIRGCRGNGAGFPNISSIAIELVNCTDCTITAFDCNEFWEALRACGTGLKVFGSRAEQCHIGFNLGYNASGVSTPLTNSSFYGISTEATDIGWVVNNCSGCLFAMFGTLGDTFSYTGWNSRVNTTSTSSNTIGTGALTFATTGGAWATSDGVLIYNDSGHYMIASVTSYIANSLVVNSLVAVGTGTLASWTLTTLAFQGVQVMGGSANNWFLCLSSSGAYSNGAIIEDNTCSGNNYVTSDVTNTGTGSGGGAWNLNGGGVKTNCKN